MSSKFTLNVSLTGRLHGFVAAQVAAGGFITASEVVRAGLRLLEHQQAGHQQAGQHPAAPADRLPGPAPPRQPAARRPRAGRGGAS